MGNVHHFSDKFERVFTALDPCDRPDGRACFPTKLSNDDARIGDSEDHAIWLKRVATRAPLDKLAVYDNLLFTAEIKWVTHESGKRVLVEAHAQALIVVGSTIKRLLAEDDDSVEVHYLRADFEPKNLGALFHDPIPHVHSLQKGEPRFPVSTVRTLPHVDFVELVHRNFFPEIWERWADQVWGRARNNTEFSGANDPHTRIKAAFKSSSDDTLMASYSKPIKRWRRFLSREKRMMCPLHWYTPYELLGY